MEGGQGGTLVIGVLVGSSPRALFADSKTSDDVFHGQQLTVSCVSVRQIFAKHLMKLRGDQTTVAVFGMAHLDGVEKVLKGHGWKRQRA